MPGTVEAIRHPQPRAPRERVRDKGLGTRASLARRARRIRRQPRRMDRWFRGTRREMAHFRANRPNRETRLPMMRTLLQLFDLEQCSGGWLTVEDEQAQVAANVHQSVRTEPKRRPAVLV